MLVRFEITQTSSGVEFILPLKTVSEANLSEPWQVRAERHKKQKAAVAYSMSRINPKVVLPCTVTLKRYGKRLLDAHDNLPISFKHILDQVCMHITGDKRPGRADGYQGFTFKYDQEKSKNYFIKISIDFN